MTFNTGEKLIDLLGEINTNFIFIKLNNRMKEFVQGLPIELKNRLNHKGVVIDVFKKKNNFFRKQNLANSFASGGFKELKNDAKFEYYYQLRIRTFHPALSQQLKPKSVQNLIKENLKNYLKYHRDGYLELINSDEIIVQSNAILARTVRVYSEAKKEEFITPRALYSVGFKNKFSDPILRESLENYRKIRQKSNEKIYELRHKI